MIRWNCPRCGSGKNAPARPRRDDTRRYCLACSEETGRLVERTARALETKRARAAERADARREREKGRRRDALTVAGVHLPTEAALILRRSPELRRQARRLGGLRASDIQWKVRRITTPPRKLGHAWGLEILIVDYPGIAAADVREMLLHEIAHVVLPAAVGHGPEWRKTYAQGAWEVYGVRVPGYAARYHSHVSAALKGREAEAGIAS